MVSFKKSSILRYTVYALIIVSAFFVIVSVSSGFLMDYYWFKSIGYLQIFMTNLKYQLLLLFLGWIITTGCLLLSWRTINKALKDQIPEIGDKLYKVLSIFAGFGVGWWLKGNYLIVLKFLNHVPWGTSDPIFNNDISFYVFQLPMIRTLLTIAGIISGLVLFVTLFSYTIGRSAIMEREGQDLFFSEEPSSTWGPEKILKSYPILASILTLTLVGALFVWVGRYSYLWSFSPGNSIPTGASYMAINYRIPYTWIETIGVLILGGLVLYTILNLREMKEKIEIGEISDFKMEFGTVLVLILIFFLIPSLVFGAINSLNVKPNEPTIQKPYLEHTIEFTNRAYGLDNMIETEFMINPDNLTSDEALESPTIKNARIVDYRPVKQSYQQRQELRTYYEFHDVDVDRYDTPEGKRLAVISGREINIAEIPARGGEWQTKNLLYTHGFGAVLSPASEVEKDGSPILSVRDIPPVSEWENTTINEPRIYYGERTDSYALVNASGLDEFDYPRGENNALYRYEYDSGIKVGSIWKKLISWFYTGEFNLLVSDYVGKESKLLLHRNVHERVRKIAPFLRYDSNAHFFIDKEGGLNYLLNGITQAKNYPYSYTDGNAPGYLSDSLKVFVEANTGEVKFYPIKEDPIVMTYSNIYPDLFMEEEMPKSYRKHIIYPTDLFSIQMSIFRRYHMKDYKTFYKQEDLWTFAKETYHGRSDTRVEAYNIIYDVTDIPGFENHNEEFMLVEPFTPKDKNNMISWIGVGQDGQNYGKKSIIRFPKGEYVRGPSVIESIIDQNTSISEQFSLWGQRGSSVLRGNLLVLPVKNDLLYIEPVYLSAQGVAYPQLKRVITVYGDTAAMENSLERSIRAVLGEEVGPTPPGPGDNVAPGELVNLVRDYLQLREEYNQLIREGKYAEAGEIRERMEAISENMSRFVP